MTCSQFKPGSDQEGFQPSDDSTDIISDVPDGPDDSGLWQRPRSVIEAYVAGDIEIHVRLRFWDRLPWADTHNLCAVYKRADGPANGGSIPVPLSSDSLEDEVAANQGHRDDMEETMFVSFVEVVEDRKGVLSGIRSMVRLHPLDKCACVPLDQPNPFESVLLKIARSDVDREGGQSLVWNGASLCGKRENDLVKSGPEIEQEVSQDDAALHRRTVVPLHPEDVIAGFRVEIGDDFTGFTVDETLDHVLQGVEMVIRTL